MILCCGEALIDMLPDGSGGFRPHVGGAVCNTAIALGRLGVPSGFLWGLSRDAMGERLRAALEAAGVDHSACVSSDRPTTLALVETVEGQARYAFYDEGSAGRMLSTADLPPVSAAALFLGGIALAAEPCGSAIEALAQREAGRRLLMIDPNIRPGFVTDEAAYRVRLGRMLVWADIVKLSTEDLDWLAPGNGAAVVADLLAQGVTLVCITAGAAGVHAFGAWGDLQLPAAPARVVDTVGAGDTFNAGLLAGLWQAGVRDRAALRALAPDVLRGALALGVAAAAITVSRPGADPPWRHELA